jgi:hypothetical protein
VAASRTASETVVGPVSAQVSSESRAGIPPSRLTKSLGCQAAGYHAANPAAKEVRFLAKNPPPGPGRRGAVKGRSQFVGPGGHHVKRNDKTGRIMDVKADLKPFKGVRKEK